MSKYFRNLVEDLGKKELTDCVFVFEENGVRRNDVTVMAHKAFLACTSPVFKSMFYGLLKEESEILITDIRAKTFEQLLAFLYTDELKLNDAHEACDFYYAAKKYDIHAAVEAVRFFMANNMNGPNSLIYFETLKLFDDQKLLQTCTKTIYEPIYNATKATNFFNDTEPLELNDKIIFTATGLYLQLLQHGAELKQSIEKAKSEIKKTQRLEDMINESLAVIRMLVVEAKVIFKMLISEKIATFDTSLNLVPPTFAFFHFNKVCSAKRRFSDRRFLCECCGDNNVCSLVPDSSEAVRFVLQKYSNKDLSTFWFEDVIAIFKEYKDKADISKYFS